MCMINLWTMTSHASLSCVINGDFFPFPWSDESVNDLVSYEWPLVNTRNQVETKISIQQVDVYFTKLPIYIVKEFALDNRMLSLGTGWQETDERSLTFKMYNLSATDKPYDHMTVRFGMWRPKVSINPQDLELPKYEIPMKDYSFPPHVNSHGCPGFISSQRAELFGLVVEKDSTWNAERKDIFFSFDPIRN